MGFSQVPYVHGDEPMYTALTLRTHCWLCIHGPRIKKTLTDLLNYKSSCFSLKPSPTYFKPRERLFQVPQWQKILLLLSPLGLGSLVLILRISSLPMIFLASSLLILYFVCPWFACWTPKNPKILFSFHGATRTSRMPRRNPFEHRSTQSAFFS